jgi:CRISPR type III-B/RAMP module RAMP protein Cmr6
MPSDTLAALGQDAERCESRSLFMDRFADPGAKDSGNLHPRRDWFTALMAKRAVRTASESRREWLSRFAASGGGQILYAQLQSRLMVNMASGVMENAGLCLDRYGLPFLPGSAVKGCARRVAIAALHEWCEFDRKPAGEDNLFSEACLPFNSPAEMLVAIGGVFGWGAQEWSDKRDKDARYISDFAYAVGENVWGEVSTLARAILTETDHFAGGVSFFPAYPVDLSKTGQMEGLPVELPPFGKLELDVVTCHHGEYYRQARDYSKKLVMPVALDTEEPVPVVFPSVAAGHVFGFALLPLRACPQCLLDQARVWLASGLASFGLGAKTAAGYGWFESSNKTSRLVAELLYKQAKDKADRQRIEDELADQKAKKAAEREAREKMEATLAALPPEQQEDYKLAQLSEDQFRSALENYAKRSAEEQKAIIRAMRLEPSVLDSRRAFWVDLKVKAQKKGGKYAHTEQGIRLLSKQMFPGRDGKMP